MSIELKGKRGPDSKPRVRRTKAEIIAARSAQLQERAARITTGNAVVTSTPVIAAERNSIELIPMPADPSVAVPITSNNNEDMAMEIARRVSSTVLDTVFATVDQRLKGIMDQVNRVATAQQFAIAIKINDEPLKRLKHEAHPNLAETVGILKVKELPLLVGPAGCGKTYLAEQCAEALGVEFGHLCFSAGVSETWLFGRQTPNGFIIGDFARLYRDGGLFLADEMDAADGNLLLTINTALANGHLYNPINGERVERHENFYFIGAANTFGKGANTVYTGRSRLDGATIDRLTYVTVGYSSKVERALCPDDEMRTRLQDLRKALEKRGSHEIISYRAFVKATKLASLNYSIDEIIERLTMSWPAGLLKEIGGAK